MDHLKQWVIQTGRSLRRLSVHVFQTLLKEKFISRALDDFTVERPVSKELHVGGNNGRSRCQTNVSVSIDLE